MPRTSAPVSRRYEIRQEPGPAARRSARRYGVARARLRGIVEGQCGPDVFVEVRDGADALTLFIEETYEGGRKTGRNRQYVGYRLEWQGASSFSDRWFADDGSQNRGEGRRWRAVVTLRNGAYEHDIVLTAWRAS